MSLHKTSVQLSCLIYSIVFKFLLWVNNKWLKVLYVCSAFSPRTVVLCGHLQVFLKKITHVIFIIAGILKKALKKILSLFLIPSMYFEMSVIYTLILGGILIVFSGVMYVMLFRMVYSELDQELNSTAMNVNQSIASYVKVRGNSKKYLMFAVEKTIANENERLNRWWNTGFQKQWLMNNEQLDLSKSFINFVSPQGKSLVKSQNLSDELENLFLEKYPVDVFDGEKYQNILYKNRQIRIVNYPFILNEESVYTIQVGIYRQRIIDYIFNWLNTIIYAIPSILILTSFIGRILVRRILKPVEEISSTASRISHEDLGARIKIKKPYVEMNHLIDNFNNMISRLEKSFTHIEEFSSHVAHEIKTPLTILKGETELALMGDRTIKEYKRVMISNMEETDRILKIVDDLLLLTKLDYEPEIFNFQDIDFTDYIKDIFQQTQILSKTKKIRVNLISPNKSVLMKGDRDHLRRLFFNLMDNAIKFTPEKGKIDITVKYSRHSIFVGIADSGLGIEQEDLSKIFERFYRRDKQQGGCGLGLSIVQSIVNIHQGTISVKSRINQGTTFILTFPISSMYI